MVKPSAKNRFDSVYDFVSANVETDVLACLVKFFESVHDVLRCVHVYNAVCLYDMFRQLKDVDNLFFDKTGSSVIDLVHEYKFLSYVRHVSPRKASFCPVEVMVGFVGYRKCLSMFLNMFEAEKLLNLRFEDVRKEALDEFE